MQENMLVVEKHDLVRTICLNCPEKGNALCAELLKQLIEAINATNDDPSVRVMVIRGAGEKIFSAGYDLAQLPSTSREWSDRVAKSQDTLPEEDLLKVAVENIINHRCPVIAMINGSTMGASCDLIAACDLRVAANTAKFGIPAVKRGVLYHPEGIQRLLDLVGVAATKEILLTGDLIDAKRAKEIGLVNQVVAAKDLERTTYHLASQIARNAPLAVAGSKTLISKLLKKPVISQEDDRESRALMVKCFGSYDFQEGILAFIERRAPKFEGR